MLVVDDHLPNIRLLEAKLNSEYYDVLTAQDGLSAIDIAQKELPDIILLDVMMPGIDGFETCKRLKQSPKTGHIPIVMVTALSEVSDRVEGLRSGADDFLTKPINDLSLFARIRSLVRLKHMMDELRLRDQTGVEFGLHDEEVLGENYMSTANVAVVDDDIVQAQQFVKELGNLGAAVTVMDPEDAVSNILENDYDLVVVSTQMTDVDGLRLCSQIRSHEQTRLVPLLILIEEEDTQLLVKGFDMGINDCLMVPIDSNELLARADTQVRRKRYQDALKSNYQKSVSMAITDGLTNVYNRRYFDVHFKNLFDQAMLRNKPLMLLVVDIDHFKSINDEHGHQVGDEILQQVTKRMIDNVRATDLVARYGGEEFVIVMPDTMMPPAADIADRMRASMADIPFIVENGAKELHCTVSIGGAFIQTEDATENLLKRADSALYEAKETGRNKVIFADEPPSN